tara:strand:- start:208 stop:1683 length:1476 start_codon:yes stop_codon:yes gene_type:complete
MIINCKKISILGLIALVVVACQKDDAIPEYNNFSDALATSGDKRIQRDDFASFADLSKGVTNRTWTIPESASIVNLEGRDPSEIEIIRVQFDELGQFEVNLKDEFMDSSVQLDTTFNVTVLDYVQTNFDVISIDSDFYEETPTQITMYEGGTITFQDVSTGNPNRRKWTFSGGDPSSAGGISIEEDDDVSTISVTYPTIGTYDMELISWRQYPEGAADTLRIPDYINIVEAPPVIKSINEKINGEIHLKYNVALQSSGDLPSYFTLEFDDEEIEISSVEIHPNDNTILKIIPNTNSSSGNTRPILSVALLTYNGEGDLSKLNNSNIGVPAFIDQEVSHEIYGFEDSGLGWDVAWQWDNVGEITYPTDNPASGQHSMKMEANSDARCRAYSKTEEAYFDLDSSKSYTIEFKIWIDTNYTDTNIFPEVFKSDQWLGEGFWTSVANLPRGEWVTVNKEAVKIWSPDVSGQYFFSFRFQKIGIVYIDDVKIYEVE